VRKKLPVALLFLKKNFRVCGGMKKRVNGFFAEKVVEKWWKNPNKMKKGLRLFS